MPDTIRLSEAAVATLRFRVKGWKMPVRDRHLEAFHELVAAGIMEPDGDDFRFTEDGWARRNELLAEAEERIERNRYEPPDASHLSEAARDLLRRISSGERPSRSWARIGPRSASWREPGSGSGALLRRGR